MAFFEITEEERVTFFNTLKKFLIEKLQYSEKQASDIDLFSNRKEYFTLMFKKGFDDLYLKLGDYSYTAPDQKSIVVSRIGFKKNHKGSGTRLMKELCELGKKFDYEWLYVECPNPDCLEFMEKLGFEGTDPISIDKLWNSIHQYESRKQSQ